MTPKDFSKLVVTVDSCKTEIVGRLLVQASGNYQLSAKDEDKPVSTYAEFQWGLPNTSENAKRVYVGAKIEITFRSIE